MMPTPHEVAVSINEWLLGRILEEGLSVDEAKDVLDALLQRIQADKLRIDELWTDKVSLR